MRRSRLRDELIAVSIKLSASGGLELGIPAPLFKAKGSAVVQTDGQRFLFAITQNDVSTPPVKVIVNWAGENKGFGTRFDVDPRLTLPPCRSSFFEGG
jgi:hypothetical protein